jgi:hypothetical protein
MAVPWFIVGVLKRTVPNIEFSGAGLEKLVQVVLRYYLLLVAKQLPLAFREVKKQRFQTGIMLFYQLVAQLQAELVQSGIGVFCSFTINQNIVHWLYFGCFYDTQLPFLFILPGYILP